MVPKEVFLSHSSKNKEITEKVAETLRNHNISVWYSETNIKGAQQWHDEIGRALRRCDWFIILLSGESISSKWVKMELGYALRHSQYDEHILPVVIEDCDYESLSWTLGLFQMADLRNNIEDGYQEILGTWGFGFDREKMG
ncbi:MAG: toll/interleukin-1 receptor domain-containing protein [Betaproteobacteria bacterium]|nr:toll/interleukin-1 receptor domain-containing protein [Betaproteobacteria bacterium]